MSLIWSLVGRNAAECSVSRYKERLVENLSVGNAGMARDAD